MHNCNAKTDTAILKTISFIQNLNVKAVLMQTFHSLALVNWFIRLLTKYFSAINNLVRYLYKRKQKVNQRFDALIKFSIL